MCRVPLLPHPLGCVARSQLAPSLSPAVRAIRSSFSCNCICRWSTRCLRLQCSAEMQSLDPVSKTLPSSPDPVSTPGLRWGLGWCQAFFGELSSPRSSGIDSGYGRCRSQTRGVRCCGWCTLQWRTSIDRDSLYRYIFPSEQKRKKELQ